MPPALLRRRPRYPPCPWSLLRSLLRSSARGVSVLACTTCPSRMTRLGWVEKTSRAAMKAPLPATEHLVVSIIVNRKCERRAIIRPRYTAYLFIRYLISPASSSRERSCSSKFTACPASNAEPVLRASILISRGVTERVDEAGRI